MIHITNAETGEALGTLSEGELQFLIDSMEEETSDDQDYYINQATIDFLISRGADQRVIALLTEALGTHKGITIAWS